MRLSKQKRFSSLLLLLVYSLISLLVFTACMQENPDMSELLNQERAKLAAEFPRKTNKSAGEINARRQEAELLLPEDGWEGPVVTWALQSASLSQIPDLDRINAYLAESEASYRLGIYVFFTNDDNRIGGDYYEALQPYLQRGEIDLIAAGKYNTRGDRLASDYLLEQGQVQEIEPKEHFRRSHLQYEGKYYGLGKPYPAMRYGFLVDKAFAQEFKLTADSDVSFAWLIDHKEELKAWSRRAEQPVFELTFDPCLLATEYVIPEGLVSRFLYLDEEGKAGLLWQAPSLKRYEQLWGALASSPSFDDLEAKNFAAPIRLDFEYAILEKNTDGTLKSESGDCDLFFPLGRIVQPQHWRVCLENLLAKTSKHRAEALDFLYRLYEDSHLAEILQAQPDYETMTCADWYGENKNQGRLYNTYLLDTDRIFPLGLEEDTVNVGGCWYGYFPEEIVNMPEFAACLDFLATPEGKELRQKAFASGAEADEARENLRLNLQKMGLDQVLQSLEEDAREFLRETGQKAEGEE